MFNQLNKIYYFTGILHRNIYTSFNSFHFFFPISEFRSLFNHFCNHSCVWHCEDEYKYIHSITHHIGWSCWAIDLNRECRKEHMHSIVEQTLETALLYKTVMCLKLSGSHAIHGILGSHVMFLEPQTVAYIRNNSVTKFLWNKWVSSLFDTAVRYIPACIYTCNNWLHLDTSLRSCMDHSNIRWRLRTMECNNCKVTESSIWDFTKRDSTYQHRWFNKWFGRLAAHETRFQFHLSWPRLI